MMTRIMSVSLHFLKINGHTFKGSYSVILIFNWGLLLKKEFALSRSKFLSCKRSFWNSSAIQGIKQSQKLSPFEKWLKNVHVYPYILKRGSS